MDRFGLRCSLGVRIAPMLPIVSDNAIRDRPFVPLRDMKSGEPTPDRPKLRAPEVSEASEYDPAMLGDRIDGYIDYAENFYLVRDQNVFTSIFNTFVSTTATVAHGATSILRVGTGAAQGVEQIKNAQDGWDVAIGACRVLSDAGEIAGTAVGVAGTAARVAKAGARAVKLTKAARSAAAIEGTSTGAAATVAKRTKRLAHGRVITEPDLPSRTIAESGEVRIQHNYRSNDHPPAHVHIRGGGPEVRVGKNGRPIGGDPAPTAVQQEVIDANKGAIRRATSKIGRWLWFNEQ
jgi:hypothetical protein